MAIYTNTAQLEIQRTKLQDRLDASKTQAERNAMGQFATPMPLALDIVKQTQTLLSTKQPIDFLDPAFGTGVFYSALLHIYSTQINQATGYEIDPHYGQIAQQLWQKTPLKLEIADFTTVPVPTTEEQKANLIICNPPYVRHHHISTEDKSKLQAKAQKITGIKLHGLTGLYGYFILISHNWLRDKGLAGWLIPSEFMDVNYGQQIKTYLKKNVTLIEIYRFAPEAAQFDDALVSSTVVWFRKATPPKGHKVKFSYGGSLTQPKIITEIPLEQLEPASKWTQLIPTKDNSHYQSVVSHSEYRLADFFTIKRGIATGSNQFFILPPEKISQYQIPKEFLQPILPSPRYLNTNEIEADKQGNPIIEPRLFLLNCNLPEETIKANYPSLWDYLQEGLTEGIHKRYLCQHRNPWYSQENRPAAIFLCPYMGRGNKKKQTPFRFILNHSQATAPNVYLMLYPKPQLAQAFAQNPVLKKAVWEQLNTISSQTLIREGRVYGGGLHKLEPKELANTSAEGIMELLPYTIQNSKQQLSLFEFRE